ncbi:MAG: tyrosine-type recombinase/integrase [Candidatus Krumholzibacteria bacterium]|nr:tyrosine-type recombinase/integrase [Candidatus Krumholzibacteria bacterium]
MGATSDRTVPWTLEGVKALSVPPGKRRAAFHHPTMPALVVDVTAAGSRTYYLSLRVHGRPEKIRLGRAATSSKGPGLTPKAAYDLAIEKLSDIGQGNNPAGDRRRKRNSPTLGAYFELFKKHRMQDTLAAQSRKLYQGLWTHYLAPAFADVPMPDITRKDVIRFHRDTRNKALARLKKIGREGDGTRTANLAVNLLRAVLNDAIYTEAINGPNPVLGLKKYSEKKRDRLLSPDELARFWASLEQDAIERQDLTWHDLFKILLLTGARRGNVLTMRWQDVDLAAGRWTIPADQTKSRKPYCVAIPPGAATILQRRLEAAGGNPWVFPSAATGEPLQSVKRPWRRILELAGIGDFKVHDLRHNCASLLARSGAGLSVIGRQLGHANPQTTSRYVHLVVDDVQEAMRRATAGLIDGGE